MLRTLRRGPAASLARRLCTVPQMAHLDPSGLPGLYSQRGLELAWFKFQQDTLSHLNKHISGTALEPLTSAEEVLQAIVQAGVPQDYHHAHFYAAQACNNEFFFWALKPTDRPIAKVESNSAQKSRPVDISADLVSFPDNQAFEQAVKDAFDSPVAMKELIINRAAAISGGGFAWLVHTPDERLHVVNTYNGGTVLDQVPDQDRVRPHYDAYRKLSVKPVLALPSWQHSYLPDYGAAGKRAFLENAFESIDWIKVLSRLPIGMRDSSVV